VRVEFRRLAAGAGVRRRFAPHQLRHAHEPGGIVAGEGGDLFVTNHSRSPDDGEVLRIALDD